VNSWEPNHTRRFSAFLARSLLVVQREHAKIYRQLALSISKLSVLCEVDGEQVRLVSDGLRLHLSESRHSTDVSQDVILRASRKVIRQLLRGELTLERAVWNDAVFLKGELEHVLSFYDGLQLYFAAAVRSPAFPLLLREFMSEPHTRGASLNGHQQERALR